MTSKQRAYLRGLANTIDAKYQIGKNGVEEVIDDPDDVAASDDLNTPEEGKKKLKDCPLEQI